MDIAATNTFADTSRAKGRSVVSNGKATFLPANASVLRKVRRYRDILAGIVDDLGGADVLSEAQRQLCRRAVTMAMQCEAWDAAAASGEIVDWDQYSRVAGHLRRIFETLGLERKPRTDVAPTLYEIAADIHAVRAADRSNGAATAAIRPPAAIPWPRSDEGALP